MARHSSCAVSQSRRDAEVFFASASCVSEHRCVDGVGSAPQGCALIFYYLHGDVAYCTYMNSFTKGASRFRACFAFLSGTSSMKFIYICTTTTCSHICPSFVALFQRIVARSSASECGCGCGADHDEARRGETKTKTNARIQISAMYEHATLELVHVTWG